ncbi:MAG: glycine cleavage system protein H [Saprospiraceae bacterium]
MKKINQLARYNETNEWIIKNNNTFTIGITDFAQTVFGKVNSINLPQVGDIIKKGQELVLIESDKITTEVESPTSGKITSININLKNHPNWVNESPYEKGWLVKMEVLNLSEWNELMSADEYKDYIKVFYNNK